MKTEVSTPLKVSIWKSHMPKRLLVAWDSQSNVDLDNLQEEIYSWQTPEDLFNGVTEQSIRKNLRGKLMNQLDASLPPSKRGIEVLNDFILEAEKAIEAEQVEWVISQSRSDGDEDAADKINSLLAVTIHLKWLSKCFASCPGISVSVR